MSGAAGQVRPRLHLRIGALLVSPGRALESIEQQRRGGVGDALVLVLLGALCLQLPELVRAALLAAWISVAGGLAALFGLLAQEVREGLMVALPAALLITAAAGRGRREPGLDVELGAACYVPFFAVSSLARLLSWGFLPAHPPVAAGAVFLSVAAAWSLLLVGLAIRQARRRPLAGPATGSAPAEVRILATPSGEASGGAPAQAACPEMPPGEASGSALAGVRIIATPSGEASGGAPAQGACPETPPGQALGARGCVSTVTKLPARLAAGVLAAVLGSALVVNVVRIARHPEDLAPVAAGALAPDFTLSRVDGTPGTVTLSNLRAKIVVLDFWARWCPPCLAMLSALHALHAEWQPRGVEFLGINAEGSHTQREEIEEFLRGHRSPFPMLLDDRQVGGLYGVRSVPHLVVIGRDGRVGKVIVGQAGKAEVAAAIRAVDGAVR